MKGYIAFHPVPDLWYILRKIPEEKRRKWLTDICGFLQSSGVNHDEVLRAVIMEKFKILRIACRIDVPEKLIPDI